MQVTFVNVCMYVRARVRAVYCIMAGAFGEVVRGTWGGTDVAIKVSLRKLPLLLPVR